LKVGTLSVDVPVSVALLFVTVMSTERNVGGTGPVPRGGTVTVVGVVPDHVDPLKAHTVFTSKVAVPTWAPVTEKVRVIGPWEDPSAQVLGVRVTGMAVEPPRLADVVPKSDSGFVPICGVFASEGSDGSFETRESLQPTMKVSTAMRKKILVDCIDMLLKY
jgi:hypothetical protein